MGMDGIGEAGGDWAGEDEAIVDVGCQAHERKAQALAKTDPIVTVASSRKEEEDASSAIEKGKSAPGLLEFQSSRLAEKKVLYGSRKRWSTFFPPSSEHRQGIRSSSEPISRGKIKVDSEEDPKTDDLGAESQANRGLNASPLFSPCFLRPRKKNLGERDSSPRKEADLNIFSSNEDMEGFLGRVGSNSRGSAAMVKPSSPETRGKGPSLMGNCVSRVAEILEVTPSLFNSIHPYIPSSGGFTNSLLNPPVHILCPSTPMSPDSSSQSLAPMENQLACPYQMSKSVNSLSANLRSPCKESSKATVHLGGIAGSPSGEFQIEGLSPRKMEKVREVLKSLDIKGHKVSHEDVVMIQETKKEKCDRRFVGSVWTARNKDWAALPACGASGGILIIWDAKKIEQGGALRKDFWVELPDIVGLASPRWCVGGDFNVIRRSSEKMGGSRLTPSMKDFDDFISDCGLIDLPLRSASFTWSNMQENPVCKRLDRFLYSNEWEQAFPQSIQGVLPRWTSDHWPIVLETNPFKWGPTPFRV
ncbi:hypothetical protein CK203_052072 [Vitis vinifera]|uniref:Endonuclease/exonuclease/phosphatase domain-containing protein n=1 Tax=Vitis vinifera TaxID=29760 RepID=A0A438GR02_VITVI|nr:hypothetical protein CK203_052072 [Vitis vinifera]